MSNHSIIRALVFWFALLWAAPFVAGQSNQAPAAQPGGPTVKTHHQILLTGCLKRGASEYYLTDQNGQTWNLTSSNVDLHDHINHVVSITAKEATPSGPQDSSGDRPQLQVITLKMLSSSCTR